MGSKALVTGAAGFLGSHVVDDLLAEGYEVVALDDLSGGYRDNVSSDATFIEGSVLDNALIDRIFAEHKIDSIFHLAAYAAEGLSHFIRNFNYQNNIVGSVNMINAAVNNEVDCLVFTSSIAVYGAIPPPMDETMAPQPEDPYGIAKYAVELDLKAAHEMFGLDYVIFRPHNVYGERQNLADKHRNVIGIFANQIMHDRPMTIFGDGTQTRAFSYVSDVASVIAKAPRVPEARNRVFNVGADEPYTVNHLAEAVASAMGVSPQVEHLAARLEVQHAYCSHEAVRNTFGVGDPVTLDDGLARMLDWARSAGAREPESFNGVEVWKNMPESWAESVR